MLKGIYLGAFRAYHEGYDIVYQDINGLRDLPGDMLTVDLVDYDYIIATPPCNWWSRANYRRDSSSYALQTKLLLPCILYKLMLLGKPFIVENVKNFKRFKMYQIFNLPGIHTYVVGRHVYWSNIELSLSHIVQLPKFIIYVTSKSRQGGDEVHEVVDVFLKTLHE